MVTSYAYDEDDKCVKREVFHVGAGTAAHMARIRMEEGKRVLLAVGKGAGLGVKKVGDTLKQEVFEYVMGGVAGRGKGPVANLRYDFVKLSRVKGGGCVWVRTIAKDSSMICGMAVDIVIAVSDEPLPAHIQLDLAATIDMSRR